MTTRRVITAHVHPPIPTRAWDWCAFRDGDEELTHTYGWGATRDEALADHERLERERDEAEQAEAYLRDGLHTEEWQ